MKNILRHFIALCLLGFLVATRLSAQTVIGGTTPTPSALLDLQSTNKGFLPPRLTTAERNAIAEPATGLLIFNTTLNCIEMNVGVPAQPIWVCLSTAAGVTAYGGPGCSGLGSIQGTMNAGFPVNGVTMTLYANVTWPGIWSLTATQNGVTFSGAGNFTSPGCQPITLTAVGTPVAPGTFTWTIGTQPAGSAEGVVNCTASGASSAPTVSINTALPLITHVTSGATGIGIPNGLPVGVTALWANNVITISGTPTEGGTFNYNIPLEDGCGNTSATGVITVTSASGANCGAYIAPGVWKVFMCHNLGADQSADPFTPSWRLNGDYYQWGRAAVAAAGPTGPSSGEANEGDIAGWNTTAAPNDAWLDAIKTANDPCPAGFRVPTKAQWDAVLDNNLNTRSNVGTNWASSSTNYTTGLRIGTGSSGLFLPAAGSRTYWAGTLGGRDSDGDYWSGTEDGSYAWSLNFSSSEASAYNDFFRTTGMSIRCIAE